jgi:hypothetical protein
MGIVRGWVCNEACMLFSGDHLEQKIFSWDSCSTVQRSCVQSEHSDRSWSNGNNLKKRVKRLGEGK